MSCNNASAVGISTPAAVIAINKVVITDMITFGLVDVWYIKDVCRGWYGGERIHDEDVYDLQGQEWNGWFIKTGVSRYWCVLYQVDRTDISENPRRWVATQSFRYCLETRR